MTDQTFTQLGVAGIIVVLLLIAVRVIWEKYQEALQQNRDDQEQVLPALQSATSAMVEFARIANRMADRERGL